MTPAKVYIDTNVLKFSANKLERLRPRQQKMNWGTRVHEITLHEIADISPNDFIKNPELKAEAELLPELAEAGKLGACRRKKWFSAHNSCSRLHRFAV